MIPVTLLTLAALATDPLVLENDHVRRVIEEQDGRWRTTAIGRANGADTLTVDSREFGILLQDGTLATVNDYRATAAPRVIRGAGVHAVAIDYVPVRPNAGLPEALTVTYRLDNTPYLRKSIELTVPCGVHIERLDVEHLYFAAPCRRGGMGEPLFIDDTWFCGLEYPGGESSCDSGTLRLSHFPNTVKPASTCTVTSKTAVFGVGRRTDPIELAFSDYMATFARPLPVMLHYNSWYDFRTTELTIDNLVTTFEAFSREVLQPYGLTMDAFVPDDGWQAPQSIWRPRIDVYPEGFGPLRERLWAAGTRLGLWLPLNGFNLDIKWGARNGYQRSDRGRYYCLVEAKYNNKLRARLVDLITTGAIDYMKHDFNQLHCSAPLHGHPTTRKHGFEANLDAELELLAFERALRPNIFQNVTSNVWHSPWWLMHCNTIWMAAGDFGYNTDWPQLSPREWAMSYRDAHFYDLYEERDVLVPLSAMMTHGIIHGRYQKLGGDAETLREWADYVVMYYGRGVQLIEWYITPDMMSRERWDILGQATRWALDHRTVLREVERIGGDPRRGEPYGYVHWKGDEGIVVVRNPALAARTLDIPMDKSVRFRGDPGRRFHGRVIYPTVHALDTPFVTGLRTPLSIPGTTVMVVELSPTPRAAGSSPPAPEPTPVEARVDQDRVQLEIDRAAHPRQLRVVVNATERIPPSFRITVDGADSTPRLGRGTNWVMGAVDIDTQRRTIAVEAAGDPAFGSPALNIEAWLVTEVDGATAAGTPRPLLAHDLPARHTQRIVESATLQGRTTRKALSADDLAGITAAKLRIAVFDSNGEGDYANKHIAINDRVQVPVPANRGPLSAWDVHVVALPADIMEQLTTTNTVVVTNGGGDFFKFTAVSLAVRLADGTWVESSRCTDVYSTHGRWAYTEGRLFKRNTAGPFELSFE